MTFQELVRYALRVARGRGLRGATAEEVASDAAGDAWMTWQRDGGASVKTLCARLVVWRARIARRAVHHRPLSDDLDGRTPETWSAHEALAEASPRDPELTFSAEVLLDDRDPVEVALELGLTARWAAAELRPMRGRVERVLRDLGLSEDDL